MEESSLLISLTHSCAGIFYVPQYNLTASNFLIKMRNEREEREEREREILQFHISLFSLHSAFHFDRIADE